MDDHPALRSLAPDEKVHVQANVGETLVIVTDRRLVITADDHVLLDVLIEELRRIQFDIERHRPATLVIVPERPSDEPQVLAVQPADYEVVADALVVIGRRFAMHSME